MKVFVSSVADEQSWGTAAIEPIDGGEDMIGARLENVG